MSNIDKQALLAKIKKQTESFDTVVLKVDEANALLDELGSVTRTLAVNHEAACSLVDENDELKRKLEAAEKRIAELERDETQLIEERDSAEKALADMYEAAMGERPEWSNLFGYAEAIDDVAQHTNLLDLAAVTGKGE